MVVCDKEIKIQGTFVRIARIDGDKYNSPTDPDAMLGSPAKAAGHGSIFSRFCRGSQKPSRSIATRWSGTTWRFCRFRLLKTGGTIKSVPTRAIERVKRRKRASCCARCPATKSLFKGICGIYNESPVRQGKSFPHYGMTIERAREYASTYPDRSIYVAAFVGDTMIGFIKLVMDETRTTACLVHILSMIQHKDKAPDKRPDRSRGASLCRARDFIPRV